MNRVPEWWCTTSSDKRETSRIQLIDFSLCPWKNWKVSRLIKTNFLNIDTLLPRLYWRVGRHRSRAASCSGYGIDVNEEVGCTSVARREKCKHASTGSLRLRPWLAACGSVHAANWLFLEWKQDYAILKDWLTWPVDRLNDRSVNNPCHFSHNRLLH